MEGRRDAERATRCVECHFLTRLDGFGDPSSWIPAALRRSSKELRAIFWKSSTDSFGCLGFITCHSLIPAALYDDHSRPTAPFVPLGSNAGSAANRPLAGYLIPPGGSRGFCRHPSLKIAGILRRLAPLTCVNGSLQSAI